MSDLTEAQRELLDSSVADDGGLHNIGWYLNWSVGEAKAVLDGRFSAEDLRAIADYMDGKFRA